MIWFFLLGCAEEEPAAPAPDVTSGVELTIPDLSGIDFPTVFEDALVRAATLDARAPWAAHLASLDGIEAGCPDLYAGPPDTEADVGDGGWSWADHCIVRSGDTYAGTVWWSNDVESEGDPASADGEQTSGTRALIGDATVIAADDTVELLFDGEITDTLSLVTAEGYERWSWSSEVRAAAEGRLLDDSWRADLYMYVTGGDADTLELRGNIFAPETPIASRFDSIALDILFAAPASTSPEGCALEPAGWIAVRDNDAFWYDLVLAPRTSDDTATQTFPNEPYSVCDGCGTLYIRGLPQAQAEVCVDFSLLWNGLLTRPAAEDYVFDVRSLPVEESP